MLSSRPARCFVVNRGRGVLRHVVSLGSGLEAFGRPRLFLGHPDRHPGGQYVRSVGQSSPGDTEDSQILFRSYSDPQILFILVMSDMTSSSPGVKRIAALPGASSPPKQVARRMIWD